MKITRIPMGSKLPNGYYYAAGEKDEKYGEIYIDNLKEGLYTIEQRSGTLDIFEELFVVQKVFEEAKKDGVR